MVEQNQPKSPQAAEAYVEQIAKHIASVFHKYIIKQRKIHGEYVFPAVLNVCTRLVIGVVKTFPPGEQVQVLKEYAALLAARYNNDGGPAPEEKRIITLDQLH